MMETPARRNASLQAKSNARLAAAQMLYRAHMNGEKWNAGKLMSDYLAYWEENRHARKEAALPAVAPHKPTLQKLLEGVAAHRETVERLVDESLSADWKRERMSPLMLAILALGVYELDASRNLATAVIVDEYATLAHGFFNEDEVRFIHAALHRTGEKLRG